MVDRKLATALAGELPVDPSSEPVGADLACPSGVTAAAYQVQDLQQALTSISMTNIRAVIGEMDLDQTLSSRERINSTLLVTLDG